MSDKQQRDGRGRFSKAQEPSEWAKSVFTLGDKVRILGIVLTLVGAVLGSWIDLRVRIAVVETKLSHLEKSTDQPKAAEVARAE